MAPGALPAVQKLQARLGATTDPEKLGKYLRKLSALPVTADILAETRVRKTVKRLRKHPLLGSVARELAARWKRAAASPGPNSEPSGRASAHKPAPTRPGHALPAEDRAPGPPAKRAACGSPRDSPERPRQCLRELQDGGPSPARRKQRPGGAAAWPPEREASPHGPGLGSCPGAARPQPLAMDYHYTGLLVEPEPAAPGHGPGQGHADADAHAFPDAPGLGPQHAIEPQEEDQAAFPGHRVHSKTQVFAGPPCAAPRPKMTFQEHFTQVLADRIHVLWDLTGIPACVLQPVLAKCGPEQLHRLEQHNPGLADTTDHLWRLHCHKDFKDQRPAERETWREMYWRLREARERRLHAVTTRIRLAQAQKDRGPGPEMTPFSPDAKQHGQGARRQATAGTPGAAFSGRAPALPAPGARGQSRAAAAAGDPGLSPGGGEGERGAGGGGRGAGGPASGDAVGHRRSGTGRSGAATSSAAARTRDAAGGPGGHPGAQLAASVSTGAAGRPASATQGPVTPVPAPNTRKPAAKKTAPLMAKAIRDYKNILARR